MLAHVHTEEITQQAGVLRGKRAVGKLWFVFMLSVLKLQIHQIKGLAIASNSWNYRQMSLFPFHGNKQKGSDNGNWNKLVSKRTIKHLIL